MDSRIKQKEIMKSKFMKRVYKYLLLNLLMLNQLLQAQPGFGDEGDDVQDIPEASIDFWIIPMFILGIFLVVYNYKNLKNRSYKASAK